MPGTSSPGSGYLRTSPDRTFRVVASEMWSVENNLSIANMGLEEFVGAADRMCFSGLPGGVIYPISVCH